jgi:Xaa-Pro aminopeptidase
MLSHIQDALHIEHIDCWITYCDEHSDPYFETFMSKGTIVAAIGIVTKDSSVIIAHSLDIANIVCPLGTRVIEYVTRDHLWTVVESELANFKYPAAIGLNYSTFGDAGLDVLRHGQFLLITDRISAMYSKNSLPVSFVSAERVLYASIERRSATELTKMGLAARRAHELIEDSFKQIVVGMTEKEIAQLVHNSMEVPPEYFKDNDVVSESFAWTRELCPIVLAGPNLRSGGHSMASDYVTKSGDTLYFDFGVTLTFKDGTRWSSDIQRMGYFLREDETSPPATIQRVFDTLIGAIDRGIAALTVGTFGHVVDTIVRKCITDAGYPEYNHATGHAIGNSPHAPGAILGQKVGKRAELRVQPNGVYTIEPRIAIENGGSIEEMVVATDHGGVILSPRQLHMYIVPYGPAAL